jgi:hypothetical protein
MRVAKAPPISVDVLKTLLAYDAETGAITWLPRPCCRFKPNMSAGNYDARGYLVIKVMGRTYKASRIAIALSHGAWPSETEAVDHINCDIKDNRLANLRVCTASENRKNNGGNRGTKSGLKGAYPHGSGYRSVIWINGKLRQIGQYKTAAEAHEAYAEAARIHYGEFARASKLALSTAGRNEREWGVV